MGRGLLVVSAVSIGLAGCTGPGAAPPGPSSGSGAVTSAPDRPGIDGAGCPVTVDEVRSVVGSPVRQDGCTFVDGTRRVVVDRSDPGRLASREEADQRYDQVVDTDGGFVALGDLSGRSTVVRGAVGCTVTLDGFEFDPQRFRDALGSLVESCLR